VADVVKVVKRACPRCGKAFAIALDRLPNRPYADVRCNACRVTHRISLVEAQAAIR
jgi:endogenous inhibitor of DNA gyrase (YacG/DUF329 family)